MTPPRSTQTDARRSDVCQIRGLDLARLTAVNSAQPDSGARCMEVPQ